MEEKIKVNDVKNSGWHSDGVTVSSWCLLTVNKHPKASAQFTRVVLLFAALFPNSKAKPL